VPREFSVGVSRSPQRSSVASVTCAYAVSAASMCSRQRPVAWKKAHILSGHITDIWPVDMVLRQRSIIMKQCEQWGVHYAIRV
jgi:hypothetical protein